MLKPVERTNLSDQVFAQLRDSILTDEFHAGDRLPSERVLCENLDVNRSSVREALKRLEQARLIQTRHGGGSTVLDFRSHAGFDLLRDLVAPGGRINPVVARSILEFGAVVWPEMARLAARRAGEVDIDEMVAVVEQIEACGARESARLQELDFELFCLLARASENLAFVLVMNSVRSVFDECRQFFTDTHAPEAAELYRAIVEAIRGRDSEGARLASERLRQGLTAAFRARHPQAWRGRAEEERHGHG